jgi:hypothetical protein
MDRPGRPARGQAVMAAGGQPSPVAVQCTSWNGAGRYLAPV